MGARLFILSHDEARRRAQQAVQEAPEGFKVVISEPSANDGQKARFHAMVGDLARQMKWCGKWRTPAQWKVLVISGHAMATQEEVEVVPGLEGEFLNIRESTTQMSKRRMSSLIEYVRAYGDNSGVEWSEPPAPPDETPVRKAKARRETEPAN
jgi:hypothetical protein